MTTSEVLALALQHHQAGRLQQAEALYRQLLSVQPNHVDALHYLGLIAFAVDRPQLAIDLIGKAVALMPEFATAHSNLGAAYRKTGRFDDAVASYRRAAALQPDSPEFRNNIGIALSEQRRFEDALAEFRHAVQLFPDYVPGWCNLGNTHRELNRLPEAVEAYRRALDLAPRHTDALNNLGFTLMTLERLDESIAAYHRVIEIEPRHPQAWLNLANALKLQNQLDDSIAAYQRVIEINPHSSIVYNNLGVALIERGRHDEAMATLQKAIALDSTYPDPHNNLGNVLKHLGRLEEAEAAYRRAMEIQPNYVEGHYNLAIVLQKQGWLDEAAAEANHALRLKPNHPESHTILGDILKDSGSLDEAMEAYRRSVQLRPANPAVLSAVGYTLQFLPTSNQEELAAFHHQWNRQFADPLKSSITPHTNQRDPHRRLRIGYVSPDFCRHVVGRNLLPLFRAHDRKQFELFCYSAVAKPDDFTEQFRSCAHAWRHIADLSDEAVAAMIREDAIDILVDLSQHMADNRLAVFARRPAPVLVSFAGYPATSGLETIGHRISDQFLESEISPSHHPSTEHVHLLDSFWCYDPCGYEANTSALPAHANGHITFGSLNNFCKINEAVLRLWARVLQATGKSRLLILTQPGRHRQRTHEFMESHGIEPHRIEFIAPLPYFPYLELHHRIDIALDPFPYGGHSTSLDAFWMGVPVISLIGNHPVARAGLSQLSNLGLPELAAHSENDYLRIATELAHDLPRLAELRSTLRPRMKASPLMGASRFARGIEAAYRSMWQTWCADSSAQA